MKPTQTAESLLAKRVALLDTPRDLTPTEQREMWAHIEKRRRPFFFWPALIPLTAAAMALLFWWGHASKSVAPVIATSASPHAVPMVARRVAPIGASVVAPRVASGEPNSIVATPTVSPARVVKIPNGLVRIASGARADVKSEPTRTTITVHVGTARVEIAGGETHLLHAGEVYVVQSANTIEAPIRQLVPEAPAESALLASAARDLRTLGNAQAALDMLDAHDAEFSAAGLAQETLFLRVEALIKLERNREALALLDALALAPTSRTHRQMLLARAELRAEQHQMQAAHEDFISLTRADDSQINERVLYGAAITANAIAATDEATHWATQYLDRYPRGAYCKTLSNLVQK